MSNEPIGKRVTCPSCSEPAIAILPKNAEIVKHEEEASGKVWVNCRNCGEKFIVNFVQ